MTILDQVEEFLKKHGVGLDSHFEQDEDVVRLSIRDGVDDEPSESVLPEIRRVAKALKVEFGDKIKLSAETIDEWIDLEISECK